ncbi:DUF6221 family protein [Amycolatopsis nigrescens]|uniref:DUF6221 family protein n=1 Tax=Amycolatopsis nigrescens TaxID=381445 RepID=UPI00037C72FD|nr:DUF6221 family protein [Amycolatopsis nigrescens]
MDDLVAFLTARVNQRQAMIMQAVQKARIGERLSYGEAKVAIEQRVHSLDDDELDVVNRMVRETEATQGILQEHRTTTADRVPGFPSHGSEYWCVTCHVPADEAGTNWCRTLRLLALPYSDHPEYRESWRP